MVIATVLTALMGNKLFQGMLVGMGINKLTGNKKEDAEIWTVTQFLEESKSRKL